MKDGPNIAAIAALLGDPARANMLTALMHGQALTATELAREAGVALSTASGHLGKLQDAGLVSIEKQGRHRYFRLSGADVACLCSSDKVYAGHAAAAAQALHAAGTKHIYLAGRPGEQEAAWRTAGVGDFIFAGGDALAMLQSAWKRME